MAARRTTGSQTLDILERQSAVMPLKRLRIHDKSRHLAGLCLLRAETELDHDALSRAIINSCEEQGGFCLADGGRAVDSGRDRGFRAPSTPCQVSVEEKIQLFGFLKKGNYDGRASG